MMRVNAVAVNSFDMTGFTLLYGLLYGALGVWVYNALKADWSWWIAVAGGLVAAIVLHLALALMGHLGALLHKKKRRQ
jgi:uncharacterized membrane protein YdcZ (DUF606 family)